MSENERLEILQDKLKQLQELAKPRPTDKRHAQYAKYINAFLEPFGTERVYLVGSTGENSKLRWSTDGGDADFVFVSGKLVIPSGNLEYRVGMKDYVWIKSDNLNWKFCEDSIYFCPEVLKTVSPELFTFLRGIYLCVTATNDSIPFRKATAINSKVGLAIEEYDNLKIEGPDYSHTGKNEQSKRDRSASFMQYLRTRWQSVPPNPEGVKVFRRILNLITSIKVPGWQNKFSYFASALDAAFQRPSIQDTSNDLVDDFKEDEDNCEPGNPNTPYQEKIKATFTDKSSMDFVPALRLAGELPFMEEYFRRIKTSPWPGKSIADKIYKQDIFIISRLAPAEPSNERDFRLSFNLQEITLVQNFPPVAKEIFIALKAYLKGTFQKHYKKYEVKNKLRSYHMKTIMLWMCEHEKMDFWDKKNMVIGLSKVLEFLKTCLKDKKLDHYFIRSNLFCGFEDSDFDVHSACVENILIDPVGHIDTFFEIDKEVIGEVMLTAEEVRYLKRMEGDGGRSNYIDQLEDAVIDFTRGLNESQINGNGNDLTKDAVLNVVDLFIEDEKAEVENEAAGNSELRGIVDLANNFITSGGDNSDNSEAANQKLDFLLGLATLFPAGKSFVKNIGGKTGIQNILKKDTNVNKYDRLREAVVRFLSCSDENLETVAGELKQELMRYFIYSNEDVT